MNRIITLVFACMLAALLSCRDRTTGLPVGGLDGRGVLKDPPSGTEMVAFQVNGLMKTKSGAT